MECVPVDILDQRVEVASYPDVTHTADGCVDPFTATRVWFGCQYAVSEGERRGDECCYYHCYGSQGCGRPFIIDGVARVAEPRDGPDWSTADAGAVEDSSDPRRNDEIGTEWLRDALAEHASVGAFSAFNLSLLALGAPAELVRASAAAALDEVFHAKACFALANRYTGRTLGPAELDISELRLATDLVSVAERTFAEGCIGETSAALVAHAGLERCDDPQARDVLERIAEDEARHAELAWQFIAWAVQRGGDEVVSALSGALERATREAGTACRSAERTPEAWYRAGRLSEAERTTITERALRDIVRPLLVALLDRRPAAAASASPPVAVAAAAS